MSIFKKIWNLWLTLGVFVGNIISTVILTIFYFTAFALFALPFRLFADALRINPGKSTWVPKEKEFKGLADFKRE